ncbi:hypothetical protein BC477_09160 [Clavibacter michiganensis subsp. michiganensis]|nr:hypothetical protein BC477_09160 [Clavibacter michiganensis subsp. michiganensis]
MSTRTSQFSSSPPSSSVTCASSQTCGPWEMIQTGSPSARRMDASYSSPSPMALVYTTGASTGLPPSRRARSRSTSTPP